MIGFQIFETIDRGKLLTQKYISEKLMLLENNKIDIRHCFVIDIKFGSIDFDKEYANTATVARPVNRIFNFIFSLCVITQFQINGFEICVEPI